MDEQLTKQQKQAVIDRGGKLLVSAAAGSGKTKVLVDRLLSYLTDPVDPANLNEFLIITYTKAAAAELRGKIAAKISERLASEPENRHLQQQLQLLYVTKISTVHSFCADILREYAYKLNISADFRVADENECLELRTRVMQQVLDEAYAQAGTDPEFRAFIDSQGFGRDDRQIPEVLLKVYLSAKCHLDPNQWLQWCAAIGSDSDISDASQTIWGSYLIHDLHEYLDLQIAALDRCIAAAVQVDNMEKPVALLSATVDQLRALRSCQSWDSIRGNMHIDYGTLRFSSKSTDPELQAQIKAVRDACKQGLAKKLRCFSDDSKQILADNEQAISSVRGLTALAMKFDAAYSKMKSSRHVLDFSDLEHKMLDLLLGKSRSAPTAAANEIGGRFREVMVDEYQDSNAVQDAIFSALTHKRQNCFMVGDVKQSIYQFRLADPGIFLEKYNRFVPAEDAEPGQGRKVLLSSNFRSSGAVISAVNDVFAACMSPKVGGLIYGDEEMLHEGIPHIPLNEAEIELYGVEIAEDTYREEAEFVAERITELLDGSHMIRNGEELRTITPKDIVILLRSPGSVGGDFQYALERRGIRCATGVGADLLQSEEIEVLTALLQIISNPLQDIPLIAALSSRIFGFTADELAVLRSGNRYGSVYDAVQASGTEKAQAFLNTLATLRREAQLSGLPHLLMRILSLTRIDSIYASLPDGQVRVENLQTFCQMAAAYEAATNGGLGQFLEHLEVMAQCGLSATGEQETPDAVTIMSIHKSKGLEFPVVFLCGLSRIFNRESARAHVLCDKELGLGLSCVDTHNRVRYPSVAKRAIAAKIIAEGLSEEMRVLYVAMTRARDRLIMTYAAKNVRSELEEMSLRMSFSDPLLLCGDVNCPGDWVLYTALQNPHKWHVEIVEAPVLATTAECIFEETIPALSEDTIDRFRQALSFRYAHLAATQMPSKQTATQLKGRHKDQEIAEGAEIKPISLRWRKPSFVDHSGDGRQYGTLLHGVLEHIRYDTCGDVAGVHKELQRLVDEQYISAEQAERIPVESIVKFFNTDMGRKLQTAENVLREFKFSVLEDASRYYPDAQGEEILLQGVVDCALVEDDGITVIDFKTDRVTQQTIEQVADGYRSQILAYAGALERIYQLPVKSALLYFFSSDSFVQVK